MECGLPLTSAEAHIDRITDDEAGTLVRRYRAARVSWRVVGVAWRAANMLISHEGFELSGYAAFTAIMAIFPALIFAATLSGFLGDANATDRVLGIALNFLPPEVVTTIGPAIYGVLNNPHGGLLTGSILFTLWSASSGMEAFRVLLTRSYNLEESRSFWLLRSQSIGFVILAAFITLLPSVLLMLKPVLGGTAHWVSLGLQADDTVWILVRYSLALFLITVAVIPLHLYLPNARFHIRDVWPGVLLTAILWLAGAHAFSIYVQHFGQFNVIYGSLGGIVLTLLFLYASAIIFAYGAEVNGVLLHRRHFNQDGHRHSDQREHRNRKRRE